MKAVFGDTSSSKQTTTSKKVTNVSSDKPKNIKGFQQWVINTKGDKSILGKGGDSGYGDDGIWGTKTATAWNKYGQEFKNDDDYVDLSWVSNASPQVRKQVMYLKENGFDQGNFTIVDDKNSKVYAINDDFSLYESYNVVTGKNRGEAKEVVKTNAVDTLKNKWSDAWDKMFDDGIQSAFDYIKKCYIDTLENVKETPSGVFRRSGLIWNAIQDTLLTNFAENIYGKAYIGWESLDGKTIPFGFHGTQNKARLEAMNPSNMDSCRRKMSYGCINFREQDILNINDFISSGDYSFWLSDDGKTILPWNG